MPPDGSASPDAVTSATTGAAPSRRCWPTTTRPLEGSTPSHTRYQRAACIGIPAASSTVAPPHPDLRRRAVRTDQQRDAAIPALLRHQNLTGLCDARSRHHSPRARGIRVACGAVLDDAVGTEMNRLAPTGKGSVKTMRQILEAHAWAVRVRIAAQHAHQLNAVRPAVAHADKGAEGLARTVREAVQIAGDRQFILSHAAQAGGRRMTVSSRFNGGSTALDGPSRPRHREASSELTARQGLRSRQRGLGHATHRCTAVFIARPSPRWLRRPVLRSHSNARMSAATSPSARKPTSTAWTR